MRLNLAVAIVLLSSLASAQQQERRIVRPIDNASVVRLRGTVHPRIANATDRGPVSPTMRLERMTLVFQPTAQQQAALDQLLAEQQDRNSPNYHKWLTPEEFGDRFGMSQADIALASQWLTSQGFTVEEVARGRTWIAFSGIAAQAEAAFHSSIHSYVAGGVTHYAASSDVSVPDAFAGIVAGVGGLHDFRPHVHSRARTAGPRLTSSLSGNHFIAPGDYGTIYNLPDYSNGVFQSGNDGTGQTIGIVGQTSGTNAVAVSTVSSDTTTFRTVSGLPSGSLTLTPVGSPTTFTSSEADEANLDIQWSGAVAPNAAIIFAYSSNALTSSLQYLVNQNVASVISLSYGDCEAHFNASDITTIEGYLSQANSQGQTVTAAAGDDGATDCDGTAEKPAATATSGLAVDYPASSQYVTAMGGTEFTGDGTASLSGPVALATQYWSGSLTSSDTRSTAFSYIPESTWNDTASTKTNIATGGGMSNQFHKPAWQSGTGVPADDHRYVPDLALASSPSHDGLIICSQGSCQSGYRRNSDQTFTVIGGTSAAAPTFAAVSALADQKLGSRQGNINAKIYSLAASAQWAFNDVTTGDNQTVCTVGTADCTSSPIGYSAGPGYDLVTGWGSIDASGFLNALAGQPAQPTYFLSPASRSVSVVGAATTTTIPIGIVARQGMTGTVGLTCTLTGFSNGENCAIDPSSPIPGSANLMIASNPNHGLLGSSTGSVSVQTVTGSQSQSLTLPVTVNYGDFTLTAASQELTVAVGGSVTDEITVTSSSGFTDTIALGCTIFSGLACSLSPPTVTVPANGSATAVMTVSASSSATPGSSGGFDVSGIASLGSRYLSLGAAVATGDFTVTVSAPVISVSSGTAITDNLTVAAVSGFSSDVALTCSVPSSLGATACTIAPATATGGSGTALITITGAVLSRERGGPWPHGGRGMGAYASLVLALGMVLAARPDSGRRAKRALRNGLFGLLLLCIALGAMSCGGSNNNGGGGGSGSTSLNGNLTITGTSGSISHSTTINVTVH